MIKVLIAAIIYLLTPIFFLWWKKKKGKQERLFKGSLWIGVILIIIGISVVCWHLNTINHLSTFTNGVIPWEKIVFDVFVWTYIGYSFLLHTVICTFPKKKRGLPKIF